MGIDFRNKNLFIISSNIWEHINMTNKRTINFMTCSPATFFQYYDTSSKLRENESTEREMCPCCGKTRYSYEEAKHIMKSIKTGKEKRSHNRIFLRAYKCKGWWHLTSRKTDEGQRKLEYCA